MSNKKKKTVFVCQSCGYRALKWMGKCPDCSSWDSFAEEAAPGSAAARIAIPGVASIDPVPMTEAVSDVEERWATEIQEFDRVLGGGVVPGSLVLIGGDPGIGKSTLMLQSLFGLAESGRKVLYVSGEESVGQISHRGRRLNAMSKDVWLLSEVDMDTILNQVDKQSPDVLVIDSIQTMFNPEITSAPGSVTQVRESTMRLMLMAKKTGVSVFLIGHVTKDGAIAGPRLTEHMVDTVLYFEGDRNHVFRILRAVKNRFGSTNEIGVFEMKDKGLSQVLNPSAVFLSERPAHAAGSVVTASMEGSRPILVELQALASSSGFGTPRRTVLGMDANRVALLMAVLEKKVGLQLAGHDMFMNVAGGVKLNEPAIDLAVIAAIASSFLDRPVPDRTLVLGEVGLTGEVRAVSHMDARLGEAEKMGFNRCLAPATSVKRISKSEGMEIVPVKTVNSALEVLF